MEREQRAAVVAEAKEWLGTKYHHNASLKGVGTDCAGLPFQVYRAAGLLPADMVLPAYSPQWHLHRSEEQYADRVLEYAREIEQVDLGDGDLILWKWGRTFSHGGIVVGPDLVIHAYIDTGVQLDNIKIHPELSWRPMRFFSLWGR